MKLNITCSCGRELTTKNAKSIGRQEHPKKLMLMINCKYCGSTAAVIKPKGTK
jgi:redox-regulated HSP33 family molecular chaperone